MLLAFWYLSMMGGPFVFSYTRTASPPLQAFFSMVSKGQRLPPLSFGEPRRSARLQGQARLSRISWSTLNKSLLKDLLANALIDDPISLHEDPKKAHEDLDSIETKHINQSYHSNEWDFINMSIRRPPKPSQSSVDESLKSQGSHTPTTDPNFQIQLERKKVYRPTKSREPANIQEIQDYLERSRASRSPDTEAFLDYQGAVEVDNKTSVLFESRLRLLNKRVYWLDRLQKSNNSI